MAKKQKTIFYSIIGIIIVLLLVWWGVSVFQEKQNALPPTEVESIGEQVKGNENATIRMVEFSDFQCPACKLQQQFVSGSLQTFENLEVVFKHFPLDSIHPNAQMAAQASESAGIQGKFWEMHDLLFAKQEEWSNYLNPKNKFADYAEELGLDRAQFLADLNNPAVLAKIEADIAEGEALGVNATPSFFINGARIQSDADFLSAMGQS